MTMSSRTALSGTPVGAKVADVRSRRRAGGVAVLLCLAAAGTACTSTGSATRAGGSPTTVVLRLGTDDPESAPTSHLLTRFAERVAELSDGELEIEPVWAANGGEGPDTRDWDQRIARQVVSGDLDLGLVPARAWDTEGVLSLRVFSAPMLLDSHQLVAEVVASDLGDTALAGLEGIGVTGLALLPGGLRHVFAFGKPMTTPDDFAGTTVRTPRSDTGFALFEAWGAVPADLKATFDAGVRDGTVGAADSSFDRAPNLPTLATTGGNVTTSANLQVLVVGTDALDDLSDEHADALRTAATEVREKVLAEPADEAALAAAYCAAGGTVIIAGAGDVAALRQAAEPVYADLEQDATTRKAIARIEGLKREVARPAPIEPCGPTDASDSGTNRPSLAADTTGAFPEGVYRRSIPADLLLAKGASQEDANNHAGLWTMTFEDGEITIEDVRVGDGQRSSDSGPYCVENGRVNVALGQPGGQCVTPVLFSAAWSLDGRQLSFSEVGGGSTRAANSFSDALWASAPWVRVD